MNENKTKARLLAGEPVFGCFVRYPSPALVEVLAYQGWDFVVFDAEHGTLQPEDCEGMVRAAELRGTTPVVRVTTNQAPVILRFMDTGAQGVHIPWVNSAGEAEAAVRAVKYHPRGERGLASVRAADYGQTEPLSEYIQRANRETLVVVHIETAEAVKNIQKIAAVEGVDVIFIGPTDLSHSLGHTGDLDHPVVQEAMDRVVQVVAESLPALGIYARNEEAVRIWRGRGVQYFATSMEALLLPAVRTFLDEVRQA